MNKAFLFIWFLFLSSMVFAQSKEFKVPKENNGYFDMLATRNDTVLIGEKSAHILSEKTYEAYQSFKNNYLECLNERENDVVNITAKLNEFEKTLDNLLAEIGKQENLSSKVFIETEKSLNNLISDLNKDIENLNGVQHSIDEAEEKLVELEKKLKKERVKLFWRKIGDLLIAGGLGVLIGATFLGG